MQKTQTQLIKVIWNFKQAKVLSTSLANFRIWQWEENDRYSFFLKKKFFF